MPLLTGDPKAVRAAASKLYPHDHLWFAERSYANGEYWVYDLTNPVGTTLMCRILTVTDETPVEGMDQFFVYRGEVLELDTVRDVVCLHCTHGLTCTLEGWNFRGKRGPKWTPLKESST